MALTLLQMKAQFPDPMRQGIVDLLMQNSRIMRRLNFVSAKGLAYPYSQRARLPGVAFRGLNEDYTATAGVTNPAVERLTILGGSIKTDHVAIDLKGDGVRVNQIASQMESAAKFFDKNFFNGDTATDVKGFDGLKKRLTGTQLKTQSAHGAVITWEKVVELQDAVEGSNAEKVLFMNQTNRRNLILDAMADPNGKFFVEIDATRGVYRFNGSEIEEVWYDETETAILPFTETCGNGTTCSSVYCVRFGGAVDERAVQGLSGLTENVKHRGPITHGTYLEDVVEMVAGIGLFGGYCAARLQGTKAA